MQWLTSGCSTWCLRLRGLVAAPRRIRQNHRGADTAHPVSVQVLQPSVTARGNSCARIPGRALMGLGMEILGWVWKSQAGAESGAGRVTVHLVISVAREWACEARQWSSELKSPCIWELRVWPHSKQHSRMPVPCHLVPACNTCHESANLLPPSFLLFPGIQVLQVLTLHISIALSRMVHPWPGRRRD